MEDKNLQRLKKRSISSVITLTLRTVLLQLIAFVGYFFVTIFLDQKQLGLFILVSAVIDILTYFSDIGLAAALIQKKEPIILEEIRSTFTIQQFLVVSLIIILFIFSPLIRKYYSFGNEGMFLLYAFAIAFFMSSLKTIPSVLLERKLKFEKIVFPQIVETIVFNLIVVFLAWKGLGVTSYAFAVLARAFTGTILIYILAPWKIGFSFSKKSLKKLLKFGLPYQVNTLIAVVKDKFMILFLGGVIGQAGLGLIGWAEKWANMPLRYFLDSTNKVAFPAFARMQHDQNKLKRGIEAALYFLVVLIFPSLIGLSLLSIDLVKIIPRYLKWQPALLPLFLYAGSAMWATVSTLLTNALTAMGEIKTVLKLMVMWTILSWIFTPILAIKLGFIGVPLAAFIVSLSSIVAIAVTLRYIKFDLLGSILPAALSSLVMASFLIVIKNRLPLNMISVIIKIVLGIIIYFLTLFLINKDKLLKEVKIILSYVKK